MKETPKLLRSFLFAPASHARRVERVDDFGADAIVLDLEDAVADSEKVAAREAVAPALANYKIGMRCVRVNGMTTGLTYGDLDSVVCSDLDAVILPKAESSEQLALVDAELRRLEAREGLPEGEIALLPLIETALAMVRVDDIALNAPARVPALIFGLGDFTAELGIEPTVEGEELLHARSRIVVASRAGKLLPPIDGPFVDLRDSEGLLANTQRSRRLGFQGRVVVYPPQVDPVHQGYSLVPTEELDRARNVVSAFESAEASGSASIQVDGRFVDYPIYRRAVEIVASYEDYQRRAAAVG